MTENVISLTPLMERDDRTQPEKQLANELGVEIGEEISDASTKYGSDAEYAQVFTTQCGQQLVLSASDDAVQGALCTAAWDWDTDPYNEMSNYKNMCDAAGLVRPGDLFHELREFGD